MAEAVGAPKPMAPRPRAPNVRSDNEPGGSRGRGPMPAIGMRAALRRLVRFGGDRNTRLYYAACVSLLVVAAGLRFHNLSEHYLWNDEAVTANISRGTLSEVISGTRCCNSPPILYPLVLYAVQKIQSTHFSVRVVPATASVLVVAVMLLWLPRLGVARGAAFLAALLATLSVEAIRHAQDAREYSIDALVTGPRCLATPVLRPPNTPDCTLPPPSPDAYSPFARRRSPPARPGSPTTNCPRKRGKLSTTSASTNRSLYSGNWPVFLHFLDRTASPGLRSSLRKLYPRPTPVLSKRQERI